MSTEEDFRLTNLVSSYGVGTRSYNRSPEKHELNRQRKKATEKYVHEEIVVELCCRCRSFDNPHALSRHRELRKPWDWSLESEREFRWMEEES